MNMISDDKLNQVLSQVFGVPVTEIREDSSPDTIPTWDSLTHINMIVALEAEFKISLSPEDAMEMLSVKLIRMILKERGVQNFKD